MKKILSIAAVAALIFTLSVPAFAANTPSVEYKVDASLVESITVEDSVTVLDEEQVKEIHENSTADEASTDEVTNNVLKELQEKLGDDTLTANDIEVKLEVKALTEENGNKLDDEVHEELVKTVQSTLTNTTDLKKVTQSIEKQINTGAVTGIDENKNEGEVLQSVEVTDVGITLAEVNLKYTVKDENGVEQEFDVDADNFPEDGLKVAIAYGKLENKQAILDVMRWIDDASKENGGYWESVGAENFSYDGNGTVNVTFDHLCAVAFVVGTVEAVYAPAEEDNTTVDETGKTDTSGTGTATKNDPSKSPQTGYDVFGWATAVSALVFAAGYCFVSARKVTE
jgi:hypothetical protein